MEGQQENQELQQTHLPNETNLQGLGEGNNQGNINDNSQNPNDENNLDNSEEQKENKENKENQEDNEIYGSPEQFDYTEVQLPEGMELDKEMLGKFEPLAKEFNLSNKSANKLMNLAVELVAKNTPNAENLATQIQQAEAESYAQLLNTDKELNGYSQEEYSKYLQVANQGVKSFATQGFMDLIKAKGLTNHPDFIKTFHAIGKQCSNDTLPNVNNPVGKSERDCDILYGE